MICAVARAVAVAAAVAAHPPSPSAPPALAERYRTPVEAVTAALASQPVVVAFGEYHQTNAQKDVASALRRFTDEILPPTAERFSHLVLETWISTGRCGDAERTVTEDIPRTTERPAATATEIETLVRTAARLKVRPRILSISCEEYEAMRAPTAGGVDYDRVLRVTGRSLTVTGLAAVEERWKFGASTQAVAIYGGALHNDVIPEPGLEAYTFAPTLMAATLGRFVEIDLVVPEYAQGNPALRSRPWWGQYLRARRGGETVLLRTGPRSFVIVFPRSGAPPRAGRASPQP